MSKITLSARMESCTLNLPGVCNFNPETTVWAHSNDLDGGKAKGKKLARSDHIGAYACYSCHMVLDGQAKRPGALTLAAVLTAFAQAMKVSAAKLREKGLWPSDEFLAAKPVRVATPVVKKIKSVEARAALSLKVKSRDTVRAVRGFPSRKMANTTALDNVVSKRIVAATSSKENRPRIQSSNRLQGRNLVSGGKIQSRPFGGGK